eukprot:363545-Chlamydomonas_euryale.AAC.7
MEAIWYACRDACERAAQPGGVHAGGKNAQGGSKTPSSPCVLSASLPFKPSVSTRARHAIAVRSCTDAVAPATAIWASTWLATFNPRAVFRPLPFVLVLDAPVA